jgi:hypothetical protein
LVACLAVAAVGCGASLQGPSVSSPFTQRDASLFDDGVDLMQDPDALHGQWREDWERELTERMERSDVVFEGVLLAVQVDSDPDQRESYRALISVGKVHRGDLFGAKEVALISREGALGYNTFKGNPERLLRKPFMAFLKYADAPDGSPKPVAHFHISPPSIAMRRGFVGDKAKQPCTVKVNSSTPAPGAAP